MSLSLDSGTPPPTLSQSAMPADKSDSISVINYWVPSLVQSRVPKLPSLRRTVTGLRKRASYSCCPSPPSSFTVTDSPPPSYTSRSSTANTQEPRRSADIEELEDGVEGVGESRPVSASSSGYCTPRYLPASESESGIVWRWANTSLRFLNLASQESNTTGADPTDPTLARRLYVDGVTYALRGLPDDLTFEETVKMRDALPPEVLALAESNPEGRELVLARKPRTASSTVEDRNDKSTLQKFVAAAIVQLLITFLFLKPYIQLLLAYAYQYDKNYRVSERIGQSLNQTALWGFRGITGGLQEGLTEAVMIIQTEENRRGRAAKSTR